MLTIVALFGLSGVREVGEILFDPRMPVCGPLNGEGPRIDARSRIGFRYNEVYPDIRRHYLYDRSNTLHLGRSL